MKADLCRKYRRFQSKRINGAMSLGTIDTTVTGSQTVRQNPLNQPKTVQETGKGATADVRKLTIDRKQPPRADLVEDAAHRNALVTGVPIRAGASRASRSEAAKGLDYCGPFEGGNSMSTIRAVGRMKSSTIGRGVTACTVLPPASRATTLK